MAQSVKVAPIALTEDLVEGATVSGTINGVQVSGTVGEGHVVLYAIAQVSLYERLPVADIGVDAGNYQIVLEEQPESDLTIHLTQATPVHKVIIPKEYLDLEIVNGHISYAQMTAETAYEKAETAQSTANAAQTAANAAKTTADTALSTADTAKTTADTAKATANNAKTTAETAKTTAETAKTTAETAKTTANNAATKKRPRNHGQLFAKQKIRICYR